MLAALCTRPEGRRKVIHELANHINHQLSKMPIGYPHALHSHVDLLYLLLTSRSSQSSGGVAGEMGRMMLDLDIPNTLVEIIKKADLNHPDSNELLNAIVKPLELLSRISSVPKSIANTPVDQTTTNEPVRNEGEGIVDEIVLDPENVAPASFSDMEEHEEEGDEEGEMDEGDEADEEEGEEDEEGEEEAQDEGAEEQAPLEQVLIDKLLV